MQSEQNIGLDLPQKMLVWEDENGVVNVSYNDINFLIQRHGITGNDAIVNQIATALDNFSDMAAGL